MTTGESMTWMRDASDHEMRAGAPMPGMASTDELARLRSLSGRELDVYFLQL